MKNDIYTVKSDKFDLQVYYQKFLESIDLSEFFKLIYDAGIVIVGIILLLILSRDGFPFMRSLASMTAYVLLFALLKPPPGAELKSKPFETSVADELFDEEISKWKS